MVMPSMAVLRLCNRPPLAHRDIWVPRNSWVAFGAKWTSPGVTELEYTR
jgi:hypothetical protein